MERKGRSLCRILIIFVFAVTLGYRTHRVFIRFELDSYVCSRKSNTPLFNETLLKYAAMDMGEEQFKQEIEQLLRGSFQSRGIDRSAVGERSSSVIPASLKSADSYRYWLDFRRNLKEWSRKRRFQSEIMSELVRIVKQPLDTHIGSLSPNHRYSTCAVVGNSGILLQSDHGKLIDSHEFVIRLNNARIETYESKVGSKTSISFINSNIFHHYCAGRVGCGCHPYGLNVPIVMYICQPSHYLDYIICNSSHNQPILVTDPGFDTLCSRVVKYYSLKRFMEQTGKSLEEWSDAHDGPMFHYSSGMQAVMLALGICDKVSLFGFGKGASAKHHYHTNQRSELSLHDYEAEYSIYHDLIEKPQEIPFISGKFKLKTIVLQDPCHKSGRTEFIPSSGKSVRASHVYNNLCTVSKPDDQGYHSKGLGHREICGGMFKKLKIYLLPNCAWA